MSTQKEKHVNSPWLTVKQLAEYLSLSPGTIRNWVSQKYIPHSKKGRVVRFHRRQIDEWLSADTCPGRRTIAQSIISGSQPPT
ncbi:MAG TPA: DNA-binding protein [Phycisphaerales bacterium]|nr:DNA-binding protein [Phycisphaerales bacterium]